MTLKGKLKTQRQIRTEVPAKKERALCFHTAGVGGGAGHFPLPSLSLIGSFEMKKTGAN